MSQVTKHPGIDSGIDLANMGIADTFGVAVGTFADHTGHHTLFAIKDGVAVARWEPDYWREGGYHQAGWYCMRTHKLLLREEYWKQEEL